MLRSNTAVKRKSEDEKLSAYHFSIYYVASIYGKNLANRILRYSFKLMLKQKWNVDHSKEIVEIWYRSQQILNRLRKGLDM